MPHEVVHRIEEIGPRLAALADDNERSGTLRDETVRLLREVGVARLLQPAESGGYAAHPRDFAEAVMAVARYDGAAGRICALTGMRVWDSAVSNESHARSETLYRLPAVTMHLLGVTAAVIGICDGALALYVCRHHDGMAAIPAPWGGDPHVAAAVAEIAAARVQLVDGIDRLYERIEGGAAATNRDRSDALRSQVRCAWRAVSALDTIVSEIRGAAPPHLRNVYGPVPAE